MIPLRPAALFRSRWSALFWAAGVLWFAADVADRTRAPDAGAPNAAGTNGEGTNDSADAANLDALQAQVHAFEKLR